MSLSEKYSAVAGLVRSLGKMFDLFTEYELHYSSVSTIQGCRREVITPSESELYANTTALLAENAWDRQTDAHSPLPCSSSNILFSFNHMHVVWLRVAELTKLVLSQRLNVQKDLRH